MGHFLKIFLIIALIPLSLGNAKKHTSAHYDNEIRKCFKEQRWEAGKYMLDESEEFYGQLAVFYELKGWYYLHKKDYIKSRYNLTKCLDDEPENTHAKELLVQVEEQTKHWSAALCYINELLENNPYSKRLWLKKINCYRQLKNNVEADRALERLYQIYPKDKDLKNGLADEYSKTLKNAKSSNDINTQLSTAKKLIDVDPTSDNYIAYVNILLNNGRITEATNYAREGYNKTHSSALLSKYVGMLCEQGKHYEALSFLTSIGDRSSVLRQNIEEDMAVYANVHDPYLAYTKIYNKSHTKESFDYLVSVGLLKGYYDAVIEYINDWGKHNKLTGDLLYKRYIAYKRLGVDNKALKSLEDAYVLTPTQDIKDELANLYYDNAVKLVKDEQYVPAIKYLTFIIENTSDKELSKVADKKLASCYFELKQYEQYIAHLDTDDSLYNDKYAAALAIQGKYEEALAIVSDTAYSEIAIPYIKVLMNNKNYEKALDIIDSTLIRANDKDLYMYAISCASTLNKDISDYVYNGIQNYPLDDYFINQYTGLMRDKTLSYIKKKEYDNAFNSIDSALYYAPKNKDLLYTKGLVYEAIHQYDSAYVYQKNYVPSITELKEYKDNMSSLYMKTCNDNIAVDYQYVRLGSQDVITSNASIEYSHITKKRNSWMAGVTYVGKEDSADPDEYLTQQAPGGQSVMLKGSYTHTFKKDWSCTLYASYGFKYFPKVTLKLSAEKQLKNDWLLGAHIQYRRIEAYNKKSNAVTDMLGNTSYVFGGWNKSYQNMFNLGIYANKTINDMFDINGGVDLFNINSKTYFSVNTKFQYMPIPKSKTRVYLTAGLGTAPEITLIDYSMPNSFEKLNTNVGIGGVYVLNKNLSIGLEGSWHTMFKQTEVLGENITKKTSYVNLYYIHPQLFITF